MGTLKQAVDRVVASKIAIGNAITAKGGTVASGDGLEEFAADIATIPSGGGGSVNPNDGVRFIDYDGTIVRTYSAADFANLSELPANPTHAGLTAQGWNWSLANAKTYVATYGKLDIGQMYITSDGKTRIYITLPEGRTSPVLQLYLNNNSGLDIDWGDGSTHSTFTATSKGYKSERHAYPTAGDYAIAITVVSGGFLLSSSGTYVSSILWNGDNKTDSPDRAYNNAIKKVEMGNSVTSIGSSGFRNCNSLSSITIPNSVTSIESSAFYYCNSLSSITIPNSVTSIGSSAFYYCYSLSSITIPNSVTSIKSSAFYYCNSLSSITIPNSVTSIKSSAFYYCYSLSSITIPNSVTSIEASGFQECHALSSITIPNSVTSIGSGGFRDCNSLSSITIPNSVTSIESGGFYHCYSLSYIKFELTTPPTVSNSNTWTGVPTSTIIYVPALVSNLYMNGTNYPSKSTYKYVGYATYASGEALPATTTDETYTLTWYATSADAIAQTNPITQGTGNEVYSRATPVA